MQIDMHYYGTYALAITAGLNQKTAHIVATSSQFVDDCASRQQIKFKDAGQIDAQATAHHTTDTKNIDHDDQRQVWVPFHFLPGNEGESFTERLICRKDSSIAQEMVQNTLRNLDSTSGAYRLGITAHVYADTFAHYGFSGVSSRWNKVDNNSINFGEIDPDIKDYITTKAARFATTYHDGFACFANIKSWCAETLSGALGHGAVATYPDRPYLVWDFVYETPERNSGKRDNPDTFMDACKKLHDMFKNAARHRPDFGGGIYTPFSVIENSIKAILEFQGNGQARADRWVQESASGNIGQPFEIPDYAGPFWNHDVQALDETENSFAALSSPAYFFFNAASAHQQYILRDLLPKHGLIVA